MFSPAIFEKGGLSMAVKRSLRRLVLASLVVSFGLLGAPFETSLAWASSHDKPSMHRGDKGAMPMMKPQMMQKKPATAAEPPAAPHMMMTTPPTTLDSYLGYVQDKMQLEAMKVKQPGIADLKLTIGKDGTIQRTEILRVDGPPALRDQIASMVSQMGKLPPLPADANADTLVVDTTVAFNYPSGELFDRHGQRHMRH
jgi:hypothetical protein